jgi:hypothetical protein
VSTDGNIWRYLTATLGPDLAARAGRVKEIETAWIEAFTGMICWWPYLSTTQLDCLFDLVGATLAIALGQCIVLYLRLLQFITTPHKSSRRRAGSMPLPLPLAETSLGDKRPSAWMGASSDALY